MGNEKYSNKLKDPRWQKKRLQILERDGFKCIKCNSDKNTLHVHHRWYEKNTDPWDYPDIIFQTLCEKCHFGVHYSKDDILEGIFDILDKLTINEIQDVGIKTYIEYVKPITDYKNG